MRQRFERLRVETAANGGDDDEDLRRVQSHPQALSQCDNYLRSMKGVVREAVSDTAGASLWALDYALYASLIGVERVYFHEGIGYKYNFVSRMSTFR